MSSSDGKAVLATAPRGVGLSGIQCVHAEPHIGARVHINGVAAGKVTATTRDQL